MSTVMDDNFGGQLGAFTSDSVFSLSVGSATYVTDATYGHAVQFPAAAQGRLRETFTGTTQRVFDRIVTFSGAGTANGDVIDIRTNSASGCRIRVSSSNKYKITDGAGTTLTTGAGPFTSTNSVPGVQHRIVATLNGTTWTLDIYANATTNTILETLSGTITGFTATTADMGFATSTGIGTGVTSTWAWPQDGDTTVPGPRATVVAPGAPTGATATAGDLQASVSWTAPASTGNAPIIGYTVTSSPGAHTATTTGATSATVTGLTDGTAYTFTVTASNTLLTGSASSASNSVTPIAAAPIPSGTNVTCNARDAVTLSGAVTWAATHTGTVAWTPQGSAPPINSGGTTLTATVSDIGSAAVASGNPPQTDTLTYRLTVTQDDTQVAHADITITRKAAARYMPIGSSLYALKAMTLA